MALTTSILTGGANSHETTSEEANFIATDFVAEGVVGDITNTSGVAPATGAFAVNAQSTPDMTVAVSSGSAYVTATPTGQSSQALRVKNSASANVTISANSSGSTKYDWIYISIDADNAADPAVGADDVATLVASRSSSASTDDGTPPTYGYALAVVTVSNGASSITNGNIADSRREAGAAPGDDDVTSAKLADSAVTPEKILTGAGTSWAWQSWSPSYSNITVGNGTVKAKYIQIGKTVFVRFTLTFGSTTSIDGGNPTVSTPVTAHADMLDASSTPQGDSRMYEAGGGFYVGMAGLTDVDNVLIREFNVSGSNIINAAVSATSPFTWGTNDEFGFNIVYEAA